MGMLHGTYVGPNELLKYKKALLMVSGPDHYKAQFDDLSLPQNLIYGWTPFPKEHWVLDKR